MTRKVLLITYEFPPSGGGGVQRWAKMCRYLPDSGWQPVVVCAEPVPRRTRDDSLLADVAGVEVHRTPHRHSANAIAGLLEPLKRLGRGQRDMRDAPGSAQGTAPSATSASSAMRKAPLSTRISRWIAVPDEAAYWRPVAVREAVRVGREAAVEAVIATGPPFSAMMAGARVARELGVPLVLDQRDGWGTSPVIELPTGLHRRLSRSQERRVMPAAHVVVATADSIAEEAAAFGARRTLVIANGFDPSDLPGHAPNAEGPLRLVFMGKVFFGHSDPAPLFTAMALAAKQGGPAAEIRFEIIGTWPDGVVRAAAEAGVADRVEFTPYMPHHEALARTAQADVGLLLIADRPGAEGTCPAKLYEYLGMGMPVLLAGPPDGMPARILRETDGGWAVKPSDISGLAQRLAELADAKAAGRTLGEPDADAVGRYSRPKQAARYAELLNEVTGERA